MLLAALPFLFGHGAAPATGTRTLMSAPPLALAVWLLLIAVGVALLKLQRQRYVAVVLTGAVGLVASTAFIALSAPDLALTQLSVDVVSTVMLLMGLALLPQTLAARIAAAAALARCRPGRAGRRWAWPG